MLSTSASFNLIASNLSRSIDTTARKPAVAREAEYYLSNIESVKSIDNFLKDTRLFNFAMRAFGLDDMAYAKAFMRKVLTEGIDSRDSFANKFVDKRYREFAETFNFARHGETATLFERARQGAIDKYVRQTLEADAGANNEGVRLALYFERKASSIASAYDILSDKALLQVVQTALGISPTTALADIEKQAAMITRKLDIEDLSDPEKLKGFLARFTTLWEMNNPSASAVSPAVLIGGPASVGINANVLMSLQGLKLGGR